MRRTALCMLLMLVPGVTSALAADAPLTPGSPVRITSRDTDRDRFRAAVVAFEPERLTYRRGDGPSITITPADVLLLEQGQDSGSYWGRGALIGFAAGLALALVVEYDIDTGGFTLEGMNSQKAARTLMWIGGGAMIGGVAGAHMRATRWQPVPGWDARVGMVEGAPALRAGVTRSW